MRRAAAAGVALPRRTRSSRRLSSAGRTRSSPRPGSRRMRRTSRARRRLRLAARRVLEVAAQQLDHLVRRARAVHLLAHARAVRQPLDVPGDVLAHLARGRARAHRPLDQQAQVPQARLEPLGSRSAAAAPRRAPRSARMRRKIHGSPNAARPIITPSQPVVSSMRTASAGVAHVAVADHRDARPRAWPRRSGPSARRPRTSPRACGRGSPPPAPRRPRARARPRPRCDELAVPAEPDLGGDRQRARRRHRGTIRSMRGRSVSSAAPAARSPPCAPGSPC